MAESSALAGPPESRSTASAMTPQLTGSWLALTNHSGTCSDTVSGQPPATASPGESAAPAEVAAAAVPGLRAATLSEARGPEAAEVSTSRMRLMRSGTNEAECVYVQRNPSGRRGEAAQGSDGGQCRA